VRLLGTYVVIGFVLSCYFSWNEWSISNDPNINKKLSAPHLILAGDSLFFSGNENILLAINGDTCCYKPKGLKLAVSPVKSHLFQRPTSLKWKQPDCELPAAAFFSYATLKDGEQSEWKNRLICKQQHQLPVVSLTLEEDDLFDVRTGIYTFGPLASSGKEVLPLTYEWYTIPFNFTKRGKDWKKQGTFQYYSPNGELVGESSCKISINGNATRSYPQKSLRITIPKKNREFLRSVMSDSMPVFYSSVVLRNSGNDWGRTMISDAVQMEILQHLRVDHPEYTACVVYINGEYWGIHQLCGRLDEKYLASRYNVKTRMITLLEGTDLAYGNDLEHTRFNELVKKCNENQLIGLKLLEESIDIDNFLSYLAGMTFVANADWPRGNIKCYKVEDGKWKWLFHDLDCAFGYAGEEWISFDVINFLEHSNDYAGVFYRTLMNKAEYKLNFKKRLDALITTYANNNHVKQIIAKHVTAIKHEMPFHIARWRYPAAFSDWEAHIQRLLDFSGLRPELVKKHSKRHLK
jgi:hypothetical protein